VRSAGTIGETVRLLAQVSERTRDPQLEQHRGRRNFLTWAFFLAQVSAAEALATGAARTQDDDDWVNPAQHPDLPPDDLPNEILQQRMEVAEAATDAWPSSSSPGTSPLTPLMTPGQTQVGPIGGHTPSPGTVGAGAGASSAQGRVGSSGNPDSALPDMLPDLHFGIQMAPQPLHADVSLALLGFELNGDAGGLISGNVGLNLNNLIPDPLKGVTDLLDSLTSDLGNLLDGDGLVEGILGGIPETNALNLGELTGLTLTNGIAGLLGQRDQNAPAAAQSESGAGQMAAFVTDADTFSAPALFSGGMINFPAAATNAPSQIDELFAEGRHTNYNIALAETSERDSSDALPAQSDTSALPEGTPPQDGQPHNDVSIAEQSPLDEFVTRPTV
jgi:hypothetical protein